MKILVIDDERATEIAEALKPYEVVEATSLESGVAALANEPSLVVLDAMVPRKEGAEVVFVVGEFLDALNRKTAVGNLRPWVIVVTDKVEGRGRLDKLRGFLEQGDIQDLRTKGDISWECFLLGLRRQADLIRQIAPLKMSFAQIADMGFQTCDEHVRQLFNTIEALAGATPPISIHIYGEPGTGKELVARAVHAYSKRKGSFQSVNCGTAVPNQLVNELFGVARGAFTDVKERKGHIEEADGGTLFLDEVGDMPPDIQSSLLRFLEESEYSRAGETTKKQVDVQIVTATNHDLEELISNGQFRRDLQTRIAPFVFRIPPLRDRPDDIELLAKHFLKESSSKQRLVVLSNDAVDVLRLHEWKGNAREVKNFMSVVAMRAAKDVVDEVSPEHLNEWLPELTASTQTAGASSSLPMSEVKCLEELSKHMDDKAIQRLRESLKARESQNPAPKHYYRALLFLSRVGTATKGALRTGIDLSPNPVIAVVNDLDKYKLIEGTGEHPTHYSIREDLITAR